MAFADDVLLAVKAETIREAENLANIEMGKITRWAQNNKIEFNENIASNANNKRKETKTLAVYLNKRLEQVQRIRYLGIIDSKINFREHILHITKMHKTNTRTIQISKTELGAELQSPIHDIQRSNSTTNGIRSASLD